MDQSEMDEITEKCGYLKCQVEITSIFLAEEKNLTTQIKIARLEVGRLQGIKRRKRLNELLQLFGKLESLRDLWLKVSSLKQLSSTARQ